MMAATGMVLAGHAAQATTTVTQPPTAQADGDGQRLPLDLLRLPGGNSGATCGITDPVLGLTDPVLGLVDVARDALGLPLPG